VVSGGVWGTPGQGASLTALTSCDFLNVAWKTKFSAITTDTVDIYAI
jgi:hypothetical protein